MSEEVVSYREALATTMRKALAEHSNTIIFGQGVDDHKGIFGTTSGLAEEFGAQRVFDTPLMEEGFTGIAIGAALNGVYPIQTHIRVDFILLAMNQIINLAAKYKYTSAGKMEVPMLIRLVIGRSWGQGAQHSQSFQSLFSHIPGLTVIMPSSSQSILECYPYAVSKHRGPVISIEHRLMYDLKFKTHADKPQSKGSPFTSHIVRKGKDVTIVATSIMVLEALRAAEHLTKFGMECEVIDLNCISHPNWDLVRESVKKTGKLLVADTSWQAFGVCAEVCRVIAEGDPKWLKKPVVTMGMAPTTCPTAKVLEDFYYPNLHSLTDSIAKLVKEKDNHGVELPHENSMADVYKKFKGPF